MTAPSGPRRPAVLVAALALLSVIVLADSCVRVGDGRPVRSPAVTIEPTTYRAVPSPASPGNGPGRTSHDGVLRIGYAGSETDAAVTNANLATPKQLGFPRHAAGGRAPRRIATAASGTAAVDGLAARRAVDAFQPVPAVARETPSPLEGVLGAIACWKGFHHAPAS